MSPKRLGHGLSASCLCLYSLVTAIATLEEPAEAQVVQLSAGQSFSDLSIWTTSPDGRWVVYLQDAQIAGSHAVWSRSISSLAPVRLTVPGPITRFRISEDSARVLFVGDYDTPGLQELYSVPIGGPAAAAIKLSSGVETLMIGTAGEYVYYVESDEGDSSIKRVHQAGPPSTSEVLYEQVDVSQSISFPQITPGGSHLVFGTGSSPNRNILSINLTNQPVQTPVQLNPAGAGDLNNFVADAAPWALLFNTDDLYTVPLDGPSTSAVEVSGALSCNNQMISPNGQWVACQAPVSGGWQWYSVPRSGPPTAAEPLTSLNPSQVSITSDSNSLVFVPDSNPPLLLNAVPLEGPLSATEVISSESPGNGNGIRSWASSPTGNYIVMQESRVAPGFFAGYRQPMDDLAAPNELIWTININPITWSIRPDGEEVLIRGFTTNPPGTAVRLWTANLTGTPEFEKLLVDSEVDLPDGFDIWTAPTYASTGDVFFTAKKDFQEELFFVSRPIFADGFESGSTEAW